MNRVIANSIIWKEYLQKGNTKKAEILEELSEDNKVVICGYTLAEILKDIKDKETFEKLLKGFLALPHVEIEKEDWIRASELVFANKELALEEALVKVLAKMESQSFRVAKND